VNFLKLHASMGKVTQSGPISNNDFEYESLPDKEIDVVLHLKCTDVKPTAKASIQISQVNEDDVWRRRTRWWRMHPVRAAGMERTGWYLKL
jgi:hypothetical protein